MSNFTVALIEEAVVACPEPLVCDQVEYHPYLDQTKVLDACMRHGMALVAYSPIAKGRIKNDKVLAGMGEKYRKTAAQVCLRWLVQQNVAAIPRTSKIERLSENIRDFRLRTVGRRDAADFPLLAARKDALPISASRRNGIEPSPAAADPDDRRRGNHRGRPVCPCGR